MAKHAKDGTPYTNQMMVNKHNARMDSQNDQQKGRVSDQAPPDAQMQSDSESQGEAADQHVDAMLASGMTPDDIHAHAKKRSGQSHEQMPEQQSSALSSIPGM